ncbi:MAG TPA: hypothetical protein VGG62_17770 [Terracidiphilus sp.]|jgi:hypothetical protein
MSYNEGLLNCYSTPAGVDLSGKQYYGVSLVNDANNPPGVHAVVGTAAKGISGVLQNNPVLGQAACYQVDGITKVVISPNQTVVGGTTFLDLDVGGTFIPHATGAIVAQALESVAPVAKLTIISALLMPGNAATA